MKEISRVSVIAIERGKFWAEFYNLVTGKYEIKSYNTIQGLHCAATKYYKKTYAQHSHLLEKEEA